MPTMTDNDIKEEISLAYLTAISSKAGIALNLKNRDVESEDVALTFQTYDSNGDKFISNLNMQLKTTSSISEYRIKSDVITYKLKIKNYNDLIAKRSTPIILGLLIIPNYQQCVNWTIQQLILNGTMYWVSFKGAKKIRNFRKITVRIPCSQMLNSTSLVEVMNKIAKGEDLC